MTLLTAVGDNLYRWRAYPLNGYHRTPSRNYAALSVRRLDAALALGQGFVISDPVVLYAVVVTGRRLR